MGLLLGWIRTCYS